MVEREYKTLNIRNLDEDIRELLKVANEALNGALEKISTNKEIIPVDVKYHIQRAIS